MDLFLTIVAIICFIGGILGSILPLLPGPPLTFLGLFLLYFTQFSPSLWTLITAGVIMIIITILDYVLPTYFTSLYKGSRSASIGATLGMVVGLLVFPPMGMIFGPIVGSVLGELWETKSINKALKSGWSSFLGFFTSSIIKLFYGLWGFLYALWLMIFK